MRVVNWRSSARISAFSAYSGVAATTSTPEYDTI